MKRVFVALLFVAIAYAVYRRHEDTKPLPFTPESWAGADEDKRGRMVRDLVDKEFLLGQTQEQVRESLGPPSFNGLYYIGCQHGGFMAWSYYLYFHFDDVGCVEKVEIRD